MTLPTAHRRRLAAVALAGLTTLAVAAGCTTNASGPSGHPAGTASTSPVAGSLTTIDGTSLQVPAGRPAVLFFFTVGCGDCVGGGKRLAEARKQATGKADFLLADLNPKEPREAIDAFRQQIGDPQLPTVTTGSIDLARTWNITQLSTAIVVDKTGTVTYRAIDPSAEDLRTAIDQAAAR